MNLINELKQIEDNNLPVKNLIENLEEEQINLAKKIHIFNIIHISQVFTQLFQSEMNNDKYLGVYLVFYKSNDNYHFSLHLLDHQEKRLQIDSTVREKFKFFLELFKKHEKINPNYINEDFLQNKQGKILFNKEADKQIFDLLLNEELKTTLEYSQLSIKFKDKESSQKKPKI